jgi:hypothetical protein
MDIKSNRIFNHLWCSPETEIEMYKNEIVKPYTLIQFTQKIHASSLFLKYFGSKITYLYVIIQAIKKFNHQNHVRGAILVDESEWYSWTTFLKRQEMGSKGIIIR